MSWDGKDIRLGILLTCSNLTVSLPKFFTASMQSLKVESLELMTFISPLIFWTNFFSIAFDKEGEFMRLDAMET